LKNNVTHILKHKNLDVAYLRIEDGVVLDLSEIKEPEHLPFKYNNSNKDTELLNKWLKHRGIPFSRDDYELIMDKYRVNTSSELTVLASGLNLSDHYWLCGVNNERKWEDVNFLNNNFSSRIGEILPELAEKYEEFANPDFSSNGSLKKFWIINNNKRFLCKDGSGDLRQEPFNEHIASEISESLGIDHVEYQVRKLNDIAYSRCECMIDTQLEFINAFSVYIEGNNTGSRYNDYINACSKMGLNNAREEIDKMIILDYLIGNTDRHVGNFGILRNSETLKYEKIAPIFDNGNSFWYNAQGIQFISAESKSKSRSFTDDNAINVSLVGNVGWFDITKLNNFENVITGILKGNKHMEEARIEKISSEFGKRVINLDRLLNISTDPQQSQQNTIDRSR